MKKMKKLKTEETISENGKIVTDGMIENWEACLEKDKWPQGWTNVGEIFSQKCKFKIKNSIYIL